MEYYDNKTNKNKPERWIWSKERENEQAFCNFQQSFVIFGCQELHHSYPHIMVVKCLDGSTLNLCFPTLQFQYTPLHHSRPCPVLFSPFTKLIPATSALFLSQPCSQAPSLPAAGTCRVPKPFQPRFATPECLSTQNIPHLPISHVLCTPLYKVSCIP